MDFTFTEDQLLFQESVHDFLVNEVTTESIRKRWASQGGRSQVLWKQLAEMGLTGLTVPEQFGGLGMTEVDFVLLAQECGYVALPEPLVETVLVAAPLIAALNNDTFKSNWLPEIVSGESVVVVGLEQNVFVTDAHIADLLILQRGDELHAIKPADAKLVLNDSVDPSRILSRVDWVPSATSCIASGDEARKLIAGAFNRGVLGTAAQALGLTQRMIDISVQYTKDRQQFGKPIGSFQAVKHRLANVAAALEYAKAPVYRAAHSLSCQLPLAAQHVSHAKLVACEASLAAAKNGIQVHGAMGYTWEVDMHIFMKKAWVFDKTWGDGAFHKQRIADLIFAASADISAANTF